MIVNSYFLKFFKITFVVDYTRISSAFAIKRHGIRRFISVYFFPVALCLYSNAFSSPRFSLQSSQERREHRKLFEGRWPRDENHI